MVSSIIHLPYVVEKSDKVSMWVVSMVIINGIDVDTSV